MRIARPPSGFTIVLSASAGATLEGAIPAISRLSEVWDGICERLKFTAHREGDKLPDGRCVLQIDGDATFEIPKIAIVYSVLGDTVTVHRLLVQI